VNRVASLLAGRQRDLATDVVLTLVSMVVLVVLALYVVAPPAPSMALDVTSGAAATAGQPAVVYGTVVEGDGKPVRGATVVVSHQTSTGLVRVLSMTADATGAFRGEGPSPSGDYRVTVSADVGGRTARDTIGLALEPGRSYGLRAELVVRDYFIFLPLPTY
jgi:hypothetical protein